ncbi:MAG: alanine/glycine:cation symporter family protein [Christensenellales bacterium]|jgi:AGCS family alanine or glycine:cation symporter
MGFLYTMNDILWGGPLILLLLGCGIFFTVRLRFVQAHLGKAFGALMRDSGRGDLSPFQSLCTMLAATLGTGNIVGVATAVSLTSLGGGPGALFWMAVSAFFAMAVIYAEGVLAVKYRRFNKKGEAIGGPFCYIEDGLGRRFRPLAKLFALFTLFAACFGIGTVPQVNSIFAAVDVMLGINHIDTPVVAVVLAAGLTALCGWIILGGVTRIGRILSFLVPFMALFYLLGNLAVLVCNAEKILPACGLIIRDAFSLKSVSFGVGGTMMAAALRSGIARGLFTNEAGLGSTPIASAAARTQSPGQQGLVSMLGTFVDTLVMSMLTGLVIIINGSYSGEGQGLWMTVDAFQKGLPFAPWMGEWVVCIGLVLFAFSTIIGWCYYGEKSCEYLFGEKRVFHYRVFYVCCLLIGPFLPLGAVWAMGDFFNALMVIPNIFALFCLHKVVAREHNKFFDLERRNRSSHVLK